MLRISDEALSVVLERLRQRVRPLNVGDVFSVLAPNPDGGISMHAGEFWQSGGLRLRHRSYRNWIDIAEILECRMLSPGPIDGPRIELRFQKLKATVESTHDSALPSERYGTGSPFFAIQKLEEPGFLDDLTRAYQRVGAERMHRVLDLGVHRGDELQWLATKWSEQPADQSKPRRCLGVDHCQSAINNARIQFLDPSFEFRCADIRNWESWDEEPFDLIVSIGTLQCRDVDGKTMFPKLVRKLLRRNGAVILGFPFARYLDGEIRQGGQLRNYTEPEHSLVFQDVLFYRKMLQRRAQQVTVTGRYYLFVTAWSSER